jgi:hypothetical protein
LKQGRNKTKLVFCGNWPSAWARLIAILGVFPSALLSILVWHLFVWKAKTEEVRAFMETAEEFR